MRSRHPAVTEAEPDLTAPSDEFLVLDADASQSYAVNVAVAGGDLVVEGPPGTGKSQSIANLIASLAARGKTVLFVAEKRAAIEAVVDRLRRAGLEDLVLDLHQGVGSRKEMAQIFQRALASISAVPLPQLQAEHEHLLARRQQLRNYADALHQPRPPWNLSAYDVMVGLLGLGGSSPT